MSITRVTQKNTDMNTKGVHNTSLTYGKKINNQGKKRNISIEKM